MPEFLFDIYINSAMMVKDSHIICFLQGCQVLSWLSGLGSPIFRINRMKAKNRNHNLTVKYAKAINQCCNPKCDGVLSPIEAHHILPICYGGRDECINLIALCKDCHRQLPKRNCYKRIIKDQKKFLTWKFKAEFLVIGICSDNMPSTRYSKLLSKSIKAKLQHIT